MERGGSRPTEHVDRRGCGCYEPISSALPCGLAVKHARSIVVRGCGAKRPTRTGNDCHRANGLGRIQTRMPAPVFVQLRALAYPVWQSVPKRLQDPTATRAHPTARGQLSRVAASATPDPEASNHVGRADDVPSTRRVAETATGRSMCRMFPMRRAMLHAD